MEQLSLPLNDEAMIRPKAPKVDVIKNIPIAKVARTNTRTWRKYPFDTLAIGEMFFVPDRNKNTLTAHASTVGRKLGRKFVTRLTTMTMTATGWQPCKSEAKGAVLGIGVWRKA
jgi:hypothetical protein